MPDPRKVATVLAAGKRYTAWKTIMVRREFGDTVSTFQLTASEKATDMGRLVPGTPIKILLGGVLALTGAITTRGTSFDANSHDLVIGGRSGTQDAADSSVNIVPGNYDGATLEQAGRAILKPHGINLKVVNPPAIFSKPFPFLAVHPGETVIMMIERMARMRGSFLWDDAQGNLCVGQHDASAPVIADLQEGRNIKRGSIKLDDQNIFGTYAVYGQQPSTDGDEMTDRTAQATATDPNARASRTTVLPAEHVGDSEDMAARANLEAARSAWPSVEATITVLDWLTRSGTLWDILHNVSLYSPMGLPNQDGKMVLGIQALTFAQDAGNGTTTTLDLKRPELLGSSPHTNVQTDGNGGFADAPKPARPISPDWATQSGIGHPV